MNDQSAVQDYLKRNMCWGCGRNKYGLQIKSYIVGEESVCVWQPKAYHMAGPKHILNGGIIATIVDCHSICTAIADAYRREGRELGSEPFIWYVTASLSVNYLLPTPIDEPVTLRARVKEAKGRKSVVSCLLLSKEKKRVTAEVIAVRVSPEEWYGGG